jgi:hypothetical protein
MRGVSGLYSMTEMSWPSLEHIFWTVLFAVLSLLMRWAFYTDSKWFIELCGFFGRRVGRLIRRLRNETRDLP